MSGDAPQPQNLINLDDYRPHIVVNAMEEGKVYVFPVDLILDVTEGRSEFDQIEEWRPLLRAILRDWLRSVPKGRPDA